MSGPLHVQINGYILAILIQYQKHFFCVASFLKFFYVQNCDQ